MESRRGGAPLLVLGLVIATAAQSREYQWDRVLEAEPREIQVVQVSTRELLRVERQHGTGGMPSREVLGAARAHKGYALLYRRDGELYCRIYLTDIADVVTLTHELRHCLGWDH